MCPRSEDFLARAVALGVNAAYGDQDVADVIAAIRKVVGALL
jgi:hypothetical protein